MTMHDTDRQHGSRKLTTEGAQRTWVLLVQRTRALLAEYPGNGDPLRVIAGFIDPEGELLTREIGTDRPGRGYLPSVGGGRHPASLREELHEHALARFTHELADVLEDGVSRGACEELLLAAEPHCLGKIKGSLGPKLQKRVRGTVAKDLFRLNEEELLTELRPALQ